MLYNFFTTPENVLYFLKIFIAISLLVASIQNAINSNCFADKGLLSWAIIKKRNRLSIFKSPVFEYVFNRNGFIYLNILRVLLLPLFIITTQQTAFLVLLALTIVSYLIYLRMGLMCNAADQLNNIVLAGLIIRYIFHTCSPDSFIIYFFAILLIISYFTSGLLKFQEGNWTNGYYLKEVLLVRNYGNTTYRKAINAVNINIYKISSRVVIVWQVSGFIVPFLPPSLLLIYLFIGFCFHLSTGIFMGLNNFIWTFIAFLPTLIFINSRVYHSF